jgi:hypothetical protein
MPEQAYRELFSESVTLYPPAGRDFYGAESWSPDGTVHPAHVVREQRLSRANGMEVVEDGRVYVWDAPDTVTAEWLMVLPDSASPVLLTVVRPHDETGEPHHTVIRFGNGFRG